MRAGFPVREHPEPCLVVFGGGCRRPGPRAGSGGPGGDRRRPGTVRASRVRTGSCRARTPMGSMASIRGGMPEASMTCSNTASGIMSAGPLRAAGRPRPGQQASSPATRWPRAGNADPGRGHERGGPAPAAAHGQPGGAQPGGVQPWQAAPAVQRGDQRVRDVLAAWIGAAADQPGPGGRRGGQQPGVVAGQHRHGAGPGAAGDVPPPRRTRAITSLPRASRRSPRISPAPAPGRPAPPPASAAPQWAGHPPARTPSISAGPVAPWPVPVAAADRPDTGAAPPGGR